MLRILALCSLAFAGGATKATVFREDASEAFLCESIPTDMSISLNSGAKSTVEALVQLVNSSQVSLDITVMYWNLITGPNSLNDADYKKYNAVFGKMLYDAMDAAAARGVKLRFLQGNGISSNHIQELEALITKHPNNVQLRTWNSTAWYGGGIMHQKMWIADQLHSYVGSANMDWLSLSQVKEMGVLVTNNSPVGVDLSRVFEQWWLWASLNATDSAADKGRATGTFAVTEFDPKFQVDRPVPCWSELAKQCANPLVADPTTSTQYNWQHLMKLKINGTVDTLEEGGSGTYIAAAPAELNGVSSTACPSDPGNGALPCLPPAERTTRTWDQEALVSTVLNASEGGTISLSVMDFLPASLYSPPKSTVWWHDLSDALVVAATTKGVRVRMLISHWNHTSPRALPYLQGMSAMAGACKEGSQASYMPTCAGSLEIRLFEVNGWNTSAYPAYSRVNHAKYIVTDSRVNIGTSNMVWSYFHTTAGVSFNSGHPGLRAQLQSAFDRDWQSEYAIPLPGAGSKYLI